MQTTVYCEKCGLHYNGHSFHDCKEDIINKPNHYHAGGVDVITFCEGKLSKERQMGFYQMNVIKYVSRYQLKNGIEDLEKAQWNLNKLIDMEKDK